MTGRSIAWSAAIIPMNRTLTQRILFCNDSSDATMRQMRVPYVSDSFSSQAGICGKFDTDFFINHNVNLDYSRNYTRVRTVDRISAQGIASNIYNLTYADKPLIPLMQAVRMNDPCVTNRIYNSSIKLSDTLSIRCSAETDCRPVSSELEYH
ncbi:hypothetical protein BG74_09615 [Sodalis-like endosymbiont of Proechinophthirus fluctus]|nr:hypothetical protein BG74_09615 [Sodalis-like endosymbiont of Proechinophthirus fluctus]